MHEGIIYLMKKLLGIVVLVFILAGSSYAADENTITIDTTKVKQLFKNLTGKTLKKKDTEIFLKEYAIIIKDERGNGVVTYVFDERNYKRYKDFKVISEDAWRFTKTGQLRLFNTDIKLTWKIKLDKENTINIKAKYNPVGKIYPFTYELKADYLAKVEDFHNKEIEKKEREKQKKLEAQQKVEEEKQRLEQEILEAQQKAEEEKKKAEEEKLEAKQKAEEEKKKAEEEKKRLEEEKLEAQQKAEEEKKRLEEEKLETQQKAEEEKKRLEEEKLELQKEIEEQKKILEEERKKLEQEKLYIELEPQFRKKCEKKIMNDLYEIGTPEYKECILNKGPEKQQQQKKIDDNQTVDEEKKRLEEEKLKLQKEIEEQKKILEEERKKLEQEKKKKTENEVTPKGSLEEKVTNLLNTWIKNAPAINYSDIKFSINKKDFTIFDFEVDGSIVEKIEVVGLNSKYVDCIIETSCDHKYKGKVFNKIKISGINNFELDASTFVSGEEIGISNLDFKKFDTFKKLIRSNNIPKEGSNLISYIMSLSFNDFYLKNISIEDELSKYKYEYYLVSKLNELGIDKMLIKNMDVDDGIAQISVEEIIIEKFILDNTAILEFLNSEDFDPSTFSMKYDFLYLLNGLNSLRKFEINNFTTLTDGKKVFDVNNIQFNNIKFDYFGNLKEEKIPINFELNIDALDLRLSELDQEFKNIAEDLKYDAIKFDFKGKWNWNTNRNNLLIDLDFGITEAASIKLNTSFSDLSTDVLDLSGPPLGVYLMSTPKFKNFNLSIIDDSLKNRLINFGAGQQGMTSQQYKEFLTQSLNIFVATFANNNQLVERMNQAVANFINKSNKITLSARPFKPLSITDLIPYFKEADFEKIITTLNLKIAN